MASQTTALYDAQSATASLAVLETTRKFQPTEAGGRVRVISDSYLTTSALTAGSHTLTLCQLPIGAKVISAELIVPASVGTTSAKLGIAGNTSTADDDRYGSAVNLATAGRKQFLIAAADADYVTTKVENVVLSPVTVDFATAITFTFIIMYVVD